MIFDGIEGGILEASDRCLAPSIFVADLALLNVGFMANLPC